MAAAVLVLVGSAAPAAAGPVKDAIGRAGERVESTAGAAAEAVGALPAVPKPAAPKPPKPPSPPSPATAGSERGKAPSAAAAPEPAPRAQNPPSGRPAAAAGAQPQTPAPSTSPDPGVIGELGGAAGEAAGGVAGGVAGTQAGPGPGSKSSAQPGGAGAKRDRLRAAEAAKRTGLAVHPAEVAAVERWLARVWPAIALGDNAVAGPLAAVAAELLRPAAEVVAQSLAALPVSARVRRHAEDVGASQGVAGITAAKEPGGFLSNVAARPIWEKVAYLAAIVALLGLLGAEIWREFRPALRPRMR